MQKNKKIFLVAVIALFFFSYNAAQADMLSNVSSGLIDLIGIISTNPLVAKMKNDFCNQYNIATANNTWTVTDWRSELGASICVGITGSADLVSTGQFSEPVATSSTNTISIPTVVSTSTATSTQGNQVNDFTQDTAPETVVSTSTPSDGNMLDTGQILYWTNIERNNNGSLAQLTDNAILDTVAELRIDDMFAKQYFAHISPTGASVSTIAPQEGYQFITIGENIALGNFGSSRDLVEAWMASPGHRANILNTKYTQIGIAAKQGMYQGQEVWIASQVFGEPLSNCPSPDASIKSTIDSDTTSLTTMNTNLTQIKTQLDSLGSTNTADYTKMLSEYNSTATIYNNLITAAKQLVSEYNTEVSAFNTCIQAK